MPPRDFFPARVTDDCQFVITISWLAALGRTITNPPSGRTSSFSIAPRASSCVARVSRGVLQGVRQSLLADASQFMGSESLKVHGVRVLEAFKRSRTLTP